MKIQRRLPLARCIALLESATVKDSPFGTMFLKSHTIIAKINGAKFRLREKRGYSNSFAPYFYGEMRANGEGTEISGDFRLHPFVIGFMALWFGMLFVMGGVMISSIVQLATHHVSAKSNPWIGIFVPVLMMVLGFAMVMFGQWLARNEKVRIIRFLETVFSPETKPAPVILETSPSPNASPLWGVILFFGGLGTMSCVLGLSGISSVETARTPVIAHFQSSWAQGLAVVNGLFLLLMAYGTWKRSAPSGFWAFA
jgi:hypothetical protein